MKVTEEMIAAGLEAVSGYPWPVSDAALYDIYLAMRSKDHSMGDDVRERLLAALKRAALDLHEAAGRFSCISKLNAKGCSEAAREAAQRADAAITAIGRGEGMTSDLERLRAAAEAADRGEGVSLAGVSSEVRRTLLLGGDDVQVMNARSIAKHQISIGNEPLGNIINDLCDRIKPMGDDVRERVALAICDAVSERSCFSGKADIVRCYGPHADAAIAAIGSQSIEEPDGLTRMHFEECDYFKSRGTKSCNMDCCS